MLTEEQITEIKTHLNSGANAWLHGVINHLLADCEELQKQNKLLIEALKKVQSGVWDYEVSPIVDAALQQIQGKDEGK